MPRGLSAIEELPKLLEFEFDFIQGRQVFVVARWGAVGPEGQGRLMAIAPVELLFGLLKRPFEQGAVLGLLGRLQLQGPLQADHRRLGIPLPALQAAEFKPAPGEIGGESHAAPLGGQGLRQAVELGEGAALEVMAVGEVGAQQQRAADQGQGLAALPQFEAGLGHQIGDMGLERTAARHMGELALEHLLHQLPVAAALQLLAQALDHARIAREAAQSLQQRLLAQRTRPPRHDCSAILGDLATDRSGSAACGSRTGRPSLPASPEG